MAEQGQARSLDDFANSNVEIARQTLAQDMPCAKLQQIRQAARKDVEPCPLGSISEFVSFLPSQLLLEQLNNASGKSARHLRTYDINTSVCVFIEVALNDKGDIWTHVDVAMFDLPVATARKEWKRFAGEESLRVGCFKNVLSEGPDFDGCDDPHLNPLTKDVTAFLAPWGLVEQKFSDRPSFGKFMLPLMTAINEFLQREVSTTEEQEHYHRLVAQGDMKPLLAAGMVRDRVVMPQLLALWRLFGGEPAFSAAAADHRRWMKDRQQRYDRCVEAAELHVCASCGDTGAAPKLKCSGCGEVRYCDVDCQRQHWKLHKRDCIQRKTMHAATRSKGTAEKVA
eukprot:gnl/TRDRNA2_/TRDRNA2_108793_c2_seq1.p1 gnl/TRDRNA2_/TRDRNA2_108793_c2~~gnl/TRDRNA2_/TRDRNA2_108793_c2_seq1.p1  ORF type:complete len:398 (-),score=75.48 gnl/TRDRNA2_/TRDRNA2_108793_c2_seq1:46-1065(-)